MSLSEALESIRGFSFFFKKTKFEVQVFLQKKLEPRIESFRFGSQVGWANFVCIGIQLSEPDYTD
jgi:hypothetical protein